MQGDVNLSANCPQVLLAKEGTRIGTGQHKRADKEADVGKGILLCLVSHLAVSGGASGETSTKMIVRLVASKCIADAMLSLGCMQSANGYHYVLVRLLRQRFAFPCDCRYDVHANGACGVIFPVRSLWRRCPS